MWKKSHGVLAQVCLFSVHFFRLNPYIRHYHNHNNHTHAKQNKFAWRLVRVVENGSSSKIIIQHDNSDDGEVAAGPRLAQLLEFRQETATLLVVSRWFGGIHLGPKRFAHITNVARELLVEWHMLPKNGHDKG
jgi:putative IMPACT (imprinted ancient) family translation regulator